MADKQEMSEQTKEIIERLKAEGQLTRNTGVNSMRSVSLKLDKFDGVFNSISSNIGEQTAILKTQLGLNAEAAEKAETKEQFDELEKPYKEPDAGSGFDDSKRETDEKINKIGDKIAEGFSLKNLAMAAGGAFVGYNLLKGAVNQATGGGFDDFESGVGKFGKDLMAFDVEALQTNFAAMTENMALMQTSLNSLSLAADKMVALVEKIENFGWDDLGAAIQAGIMGLGLLSAYNITARILDKVIPGGGGGPPNKQRAGGRRFGGRLASLLFGGAAGAGVVAGLNANGQPVDADGNRVDLDGNRVNADGTKIPAGAAPDVMSTSPDGMKAPVIDDVPPRLPGQTVDRGPDGRFRKLPPRPTLPSVNSFSPPSNPPSPNAGNLDAGKQGGKALAEANAEKITKSIAKRIGKVILTGIPLLGAVLGAGFAAWNLIKGDFTSAALQGTSIFLPSLSGTGVDIGSLTTEVFFDITGEPFNPARDDHREIMAAIAAEAHKQYQQWMKDAEGRQSDLERARQTAADERAAGAGLPGGTESGYAPDMGQILYGDNYDRHNPEHAAANNRPNYYTDRNGNLMKQSGGGQMAKMIASAAQLRAAENDFTAVAQNQLAQSAGGVTIIDNKTIAPSSVSVLSNDTVNSSKFEMKGAGGGALNYGMTPGVFGGGR